MNTMLTYFISQVSIFLSTDGTSFTEINEEASGQPNAARFFIIFMLILASTAYACLRWARKISSVKEEERTGILSKPVEGFPSYRTDDAVPPLYNASFTSDAKPATTFGRSGWYPNPEGTIERYMDNGVSVELERPHGYGNVLDGPEVRPGGKEEKKPEIKAEAITSASEDELVFANVEGVDGAAESAPID